MNFLFTVIVLTCVNILLFQLCWCYRELLATNKTCFSATNTTKSTYYTFNAPLDGIIEGIKLEYSSGIGVTCAIAHSKSYWGCGIYDLMVILMKINVTNINNNNGIGEMLFPNLQINGLFYHYERCSKCSIDNYEIYNVTPDDDILYLISPSYTYNVNTDDTFLLQYCETVCGHTIGDNSGTTCAKVYFLYTDTLTPTYLPTENPTNHPTCNPTS